MAAVITFRVHFATFAIDIDAASAAEARAIAKERWPELLILKIKIVKEQPK